MDKRYTEDMLTLSEFLLLICGGAGLFAASILLLVIVFVERYDD